MVGRYARSLPGLLALGRRLVLSRLGGSLTGAPGVSVSDLPALPSRSPIDLQDSEDQVAGLLRPMDEHLRTPSVHRIFVSRSP